jgi:hypothetical protein
MFSPARHMIILKQHCTPATVTWQINTLPMISSLKTASGPHVFITSNGEDIRSRDWPAKPIVAEPGFFGVPPLLPVCGCLHWNVSML